MNFRLHEPIGTVPGFVVFCCCGWGERKTTSRGADVARDLHLSTGVEGCDHVVEIEYRDARLKRGE